MHSTALVTLLFLVLSMRAIPSDPAIPSKNALPPTPTEQLARQQLGLLMAAGSIPVPSPRFEILSPDDLSSALTTRHRRMGLFRQDSAVDGRRALLRHFPYGAILAAAGTRNRVDSLLLAAVVEAESQFAAHAVSPCGAIGLMQLLPSTGEEYGIENLLDPAANVEAGSRYLRVLLDRFQGRPDLALAAYNTGPEVVARYRCVPPFRETQDFVKRVLSRYSEHRRDLGLPPLEAPNDRAASISGAQIVHARIAQTAQPPQPAQTPQTPQAPQIGAVGSFHHNP